MTDLALALTKAEAAECVGYDEVFLWDGTPGDSFKSKLKPSLDLLGPVGTINADFVRIALAVYSSDVSVARAYRGSNWNRRELAVRVPVTNDRAWTAHHDQLVSILNYLTGDRWSFDFVRYAASSESNTTLFKELSTRTVLLSGGADSATGALLSANELADGQTHSLVSHSSSAASGAPQRQVRSQLDGYYPGKQPQHHQIFIGRLSKRLDGTKFKKEPSTRSRSLLFLALGLAVAELSGNTLWIPENGFASLNPPLGPERLGSLSTRTTQPWFLWQVQELLGSLGGHGLIHNPFQRMTKGEMFRTVKEILGPSDASKYLSATNSCSHSDQQFQGVPSGTHCGVCFGCVVRRSSFHASGLADQTHYLSSQGSRYASYTAKHSVVAAVRDFVDAGISPALIQTMPLPPGIGTAEALNLCERGQAELGSYLS